MLHAVAAVLLDEGGRVAVRDAVLVSEPVDPLLAAQEGGTVVDGLEPLGESTSGDGGDARDQLRVQLR